MADNSPTNLAKGGEKPKAKSVEEMLSSDQKEQRDEQQDQEVNQRPLNAEDTEPQTDVAVQPAADLSLEQARGKVFGDLTSSTGDKNNRGLHGRDGGVSAEGPHNPAPSEEAINSNDGATGGDTNMADEVREEAEDK